MRSWILYPNHFLNGEPMEETILFCDRCAKTLKPGSGTLMQVECVVRSDPYPPTLEWPTGSVENELRVLIEELETSSEVEAREGVFARRCLHFCSECYRDWIADPGGRR